jgi:hypothetical protein
MKHVDQLRDQNRVYKQDYEKYDDKGQVDSAHIRDPSPDRGYDRFGQALQHLPHHFDDVISLINHIESEKP